MQKLLCSNYHNYFSTTWKYRHYETPACMCMCMHACVDLERYVFYLTHCILLSLHTQSYYIWYDILICLACDWHIREVRISSKLPTLLQSAVLKQMKAANCKEHNNHLTWRILSNYKCEFCFWIKLQFSSKVSNLYGTIYERLQYIIGIMFPFVMFQDQMNWKKKEVQTAGNILEISYHQMQII